MDASAVVKRKITVKIDNISSRPASPTKSHPTLFSTNLFGSSTVRPKAKVSSSANIASQKKLPGSSSPSPLPNTARRNPSPPPRSRSPFKPPEIRSGRSSPVAQLKRPLFNASPDSRALDTPPSRNFQSSLTPSSSSPSVRTTPTRIRHASVSSVSYNSSSSSHVNKLSDISSSISQHSSVNDSETSSSVKPQSMRIKSKVTDQAKARVDGTSNHINSIQHEVFNPPPPSIQLDTVSRLPTLVYPITTATSTANTHRFAGARVPAHVKVYSSHSFLGTDTNHQNYVDPTSVPLPSQSPPTSVLSFSSHSSVSQQSTSSLNRDYRSIHVDDTDVSTSSQMTSTSVIKVPDAYDATVDEGRKERSEAKTNRKIADLEITNKSLLAINVMLEATKHKQAKEIRDLRRRLRESRLILPSHAFQVLKRTVDAEDDDDDDEEDDDEQDDANNQDKGSGKDDAYKRVKNIIDTLLKTGKEALESSVDDSYSKNGGAKVLHEEEARAWRDHGRARMEDISSKIIDQRMASEDTVHDSRLFMNVNLIKADDSSLSDSENETNR